MTRRQENWHGNWHGFASNESMEPFKGLLFVSGGVAGGFLCQDLHSTVRLAGRGGQAVWENIPVAGAAWPGTGGASHQHHVRHLWEQVLLWSGSESVMASFFCKQGKRSFQDTRTEWIYKGWTDRTQGMASH